ncbi:hypothetical protein [Pseudocolwellia agarivorans]|uniref:hypothetical protein n=1 Tax=Pseudocolwellia agarivorans TaxID=1911682 RepID=UPI000985D169|nr:hypothetical protein [Pseudocolwellia agarivorans]
MNTKLLSSIALVAVFLTGCKTVSSSSAPYVETNMRVTGPIYMTTATIPESVGYTVIGNVKANARQGYDKVETLYPLIADEAKKVGANAVINVKGGRTVSAFSWAAPFVSGTAIKIDDVSKLESFKGKVN